MSDIAVGVRVGANRYYTNISIAENIFNMSHREEIHMPAFSIVLKEIQEKTKLLPVQEGSAVLS